MSKSCASTLPPLRDGHDNSTRHTSDVHTETTEYTASRAVKTHDTRAAPRAGGGGAELLKVNATDTEKAVALPYIARACAAKLPAMKDTRQSTTHAAPRVSTALSCAQKRALLEHQDHLDELVRSERRCRAALLGYEHEALYRLTWQEQCSYAQLTVRQGWLQSRRLPAERARQSLRARFFHACGQVTCDEDAARRNLLAEEQAAWTDSVALAQLDRLALEQRALVMAALAEEELYSRTSTTRAWELAVAARAYRAPQGPVLSTHARRLFDVCDSEGGDDASHEDEASSLSAEKRIRAERPASVVRKTRYLMDYAVNVDEFEARQRIDIAQERERGVLGALFAKLCVVHEEQPVAWAALLRLFHVGACPSRLQALLVLQRWWRLLHQPRLRQTSCGTLSWRAYSRAALRTAIVAHRWQLSAQAWKARVARMERRRPGQEFGTPETIRRDADAELQRCITAAVSPRRYAIALDEFTYTLTKRVTNFIVPLRYDYAVAANGVIGGEDGLPPLLQPSRCIVPHRVFLRPGVSYDIWRQTRWGEGAAAWCDAVRSLESSETDTRAAITAQARHNEISLEVMRGVLRTGVAAEVWAYVSRLTLLAHAEDTARAVLLHDEEEERHLLRHTAAIVSARVCELMRPFAALHDAQNTDRARLERAETTARDELSGAHCYWARLAEVRLARLRRVGPTPLQRTLALRTGFCRHLDSPQAAAALLRRVFARQHARREAARRAACRDVVSPATLRERALKGVNAVLHAQLRRLQQERWGGAIATPFITEEAAFVARARRLHTSVALFAGWFMYEADRPRELHFRDILRRFHCRHAALLVNFNNLLCHMREARHRVEMAEEAGRAAWCREKCYRLIVGQTIARRESRARGNLYAAEADTRDELREMYDFVRQLTRWSSMTVPAEYVSGRPRQSEYAALGSSSATIADIGRTSGALDVPRRLCHVRLTVPKNTSSTLQPTTAVDALQSTLGETGERDRITQMRYGVRCASPLRRYVPLEKHIAHQQRLHSAAMQQQQLGGGKDDHGYGAIRDGARAHRRLQLPALTVQQRLLAREEVCRLRVMQQRRRDMVQMCFDFSLYWRHRLSAGARDGLSAVAACADGRFPQHPPVAMLMLLRAEERQARNVLETVATTSLASPLERAHYMYLITVLQPRFDFGHLTLSSNAFYMDRRLRELLLRRVAYFDTKLTELQAQEVAARARVVYVEHITRKLRFVYKKLVL